MTLKTVPVTGTLYMPDGTTPAANTLVIATLTVQDTDQYSPGDVIPTRVTATTDASGNFTLTLWPNMRGVNGSQYRVMADIPGALPGYPLYNVLITVPDGASNTPVQISTIQNRTGPSVLTDAKAAMLAAQGYSVQAAASQASVAFLYPGTYAVAPTTRPPEGTGAAMQAGDRANFTDGYEYHYTGTAWVSDAKNAAGSATSASSSAASAAHIYPGTYATAPTTRPDGSAIQAGDIYFGTDGYQYAYVSGAWVNQTAAAAASAAAAALSGSNAAASEANAAASEASAAASEINALAAKTAAESARDASFALGPKYVDEPTGRAAVSDGQTFLVQGSGNVAATEYRKHVVNNLFNPASVRDGYYVFATPGSTQGSIVAAAGWGCTGFIPVVAGQQYTISGTRGQSGLSFFTAASDTAQIAGSFSSTNTNPMTVTAPTGATYMVLTLYSPTYPTYSNIQVENGTVAHPYGSYSDQIAQYPSVAPLQPLIDAFTIAPQRNLYNSALAIDGQLISYATGLNSAYAPGISLGYTPVQAGQTYTASMGDPLGFTPVIYCRDANGNFLGIDHTVGATAGMSNPPTGITWTANAQVTFTIPVGSAIASVGFMTQYSTGHTTADFNRVIGTVQVEVGASATAYQRYAPYGQAVPKDTFAASATTPQSAPPMSIKRLGNDVYIRGSFDATYDIIQKVTLNAYANSTVQVIGAVKALKTITDNASAWSAGTSLAAEGDDAAPLNYNGTYIGANHGAFVVQQVTATAHGKTVQDVGSEWIDGATPTPVKWYLMQVVDANTLWFVSQNLSVAPAWSFASSITGGTLTHSSGATHTSSITVGSATGAQLTPALQGQTVTVLIDGITPVTADGTYLCTTVDIVNSYTIPNVAAVLDFVKSQVGSSTQPSFVDASIAADVRRSITYRYSENGSCSISDSVEVLNPLTLSPGSGYMGVTQAGALNYGANDLWQYVPRLLPIVGSLKTWNFEQQELISGSWEAVTFASASWENANNPPDRMAQIVKASGVNQFGLMVGYPPTRALGVPALRKTLVNDAGFISVNRKQYPRAINYAVGSTLAAGSYYDMLAFRAWWSASVNPDATCFTWYRDGKNNIIVVVDFHKNVTRSKLPLPERFTGMDVSLIDSTASFTLHGNGVLTGQGLVVSVTGGYGYGVMKLS